MRFKRRRLRCVYVVGIVGFEDLIRETFGWLSSCRIYSLIINANNVLWFISRNIWKYRVVKIRSFILVVVLLSWIRNYNWFWQWYVFWKSLLLRMFLSTIIDIRNRIVITYWMIIRKILIVHICRGLIEKMLIIERWRIIESHFLSMYVFLL